MTFEHQTVRLIGITKAVSMEFSNPTSDKKYNRSLHEQCAATNHEELISYCARVSNPKNQENFETSGKLLRYLIENDHWSPFEMVSLTLEIVTTRDIGRQILRHRSFSFQEFSQRYAEKGERFPTEDYREARLQDLKNRQNSIATDNDMLAANWLAEQIKVENAALNAYNWAIKAGIAKEVARAVLPEGLTMSRMYMAGTLRSWIHFIDVRQGNGTQKETIDIALKCKKIILAEFDFLKDYWSSPETADTK